MQKHVFFERFYIFFIARNVDEGSQKLTCKTQELEQVIYLLLIYCGFDIRPSPSVSLVLDSIYCLFVLYMRT